MLLSAPSLLGATANATSEEPIRVGIAEAAPFVMLDQSGEWTGIAFDLWESVAADLGRKFEIKILPPNRLREALASGAVDVGISDLPISYREPKGIEFSRPYFASDLSIASRRSTSSMLEKVVSTLVSPSTLIAVGGLLALVLVGSAIFWAVEKQRNDELYDPEHRGWNFLNGIFWSLLLITAQEQDIFKNRSFMGRIVAILLVFVGVTVSASYIALITSSLIATRQAGEVHGFKDLPFIRVAAIADTRGTEYLTEHHLNHLEYGSLEESMQALVADQVDAIVADEAELLYYVRRHLSEPIVVLRLHLETQYSAFAFPEGSTLIKEVNQFVSEWVESALWKELVTRYLGEDAVASHPVGGI
jgi:ABC-type amino acid transport substrate-binding protein